MAMLIADDFEKKSLVNMLSAEELMTIRASKTKPKPLPVAPPKDFNPTFLPDETNHIRLMINERFSLIREERAERKNLLSKADWIPAEGLARVDQPVGGGWDCYGFQRNGTLNLYPEEALFLMETMKLELWYVDAPVSLQQAYSLLQQPQHCSSSKYQVYAHLSRQGYKVRRRENLDARKRNLPFLPSCLESPPFKKALVDIRPHSQEISFPPSAANRTDLECIPNLGVPGTVELRFDDPNLIPESCQNRLISYKISPKFEGKEAEVLLRTKMAPLSHSWPEFKEQSKIFLPDNPLFQGSTKPLLPFKGVADLSRLDIFNCKSKSSVEESELEIVFDVYSPGSTFRKSSPGTPNLSVAITDWGAPFPSMFTQQQLLAQCSKGTTLLFAVTGQGADVSFYQLGNSCISPCIP